MSGEAGDAAGRLVDSREPRTAGWKAKLRETFLFLLWLVTLPFRMVWWVLLSVMPW